MAYTGSNFQAADGGGDIGLYDEDELDILRNELLEAYSTGREKMLTRDQVAEMKRTEYAMQQTINQEIKKKHDESVKEELKGKQIALTRFYESILTEEVDSKGKKSRKKDRKQRPESTASFGTSYHEMYAVYHDPMTTDVADVDVDSNNEIEIVQGHTGSRGGGTGGTGVGRLTPLKTPDERTSSREKSKFVLRTVRGKYAPQVPFDEVVENRRPTGPPQRKDMRYSKDHNRFSFDVDVKGPFYQTIDPSLPAPRVREVATQVMLMDDEDRHSLTSGGYSYEEEEQAGGDASSSDHSEFGEDGELKGKSLERKESKRREAETMARPRGYKDLDLSEEMPYLTFEAEIQVGGHDLDKEQAVQMGLTIPKEKDNILWPTCKEFDMDTISKKIEDYIKTCWTIDPKWLFMVQVLEVYHTNYRKKYVFEVKFSIPSATTPVPPATASVFFTFEIPVYSSKHEPVNVSYVLEGTRFAHSPGKIPFQDKWLWGIIGDKLRVQKAVNF